MTATPSIAPGFLEAIQAAYEPESRSMSPAAFILRRVFGVEPLAGIDSREACRAYLNACAEVSRGASYTEGPNLAILCTPFFVAYCNADAGTVFTRGVTWDESRIVGATSPFDLGYTQQFHSLFAFRAFIDAVKQFVEQPAVAPVATPQLIAELAATIAQAGVGNAEDNAVILQRAFGGGEK